MKIVVVLPAYNEEQALPHLLDSLIENLSEDGKDYSIIVVNDGSRDRTGEVADSYAKRHPIFVLHNNSNMGLAETMRRGLMNPKVTTRTTWAVRECSQYSASSKCFSNSARSN